MSKRRPWTDRLARLAARIAMDRRGGTAIEYGLIVGLIVVAMIGAFISLANRTTGMWNTVSARVISGT